jgi:hypothetical protein
MSIYDYEADRGRDCDERAEQRIEEDIDRHIEEHGSGVPYGMGPEVKRRRTELSWLRERAQNAGGMYGAVAGYWIERAQQAINTHWYDGYARLAWEALNEKAPGA